MDSNKAERSQSLSRLMLRRCLISFGIGLVVGDIVIFALGEGLPVISKVLGIIGILMIAGGYSI
jgi:cytochrome bd-type quinol oxidase subunit 1